VVAVRRAVHHPPAVAVPLNDAVGLRAGDELVGKVPLVRLPLATSPKSVLVVILQPRLADVPAGFHALSLAFPFRALCDVSVKKNARISKREDHRAALHCGCFSEESVALTRGIVEHKPLPTQGVYPLARAAGKAPGAEGHLPITAGRTLAHLEVES